MYLHKGDPPELCKERFANAHTPRFFLYEQVFKLIHVILVNKVPVVRSLVGRLRLPYREGFPQSFTLRVSALPHRR